MRDTIKRTVLRAFPELAGGYHLPRFARVIGIADPPAAGDTADEFRPRYAVDLELLDVHGNADSSLPTLHAVPLPVATCGPESGQFSYPARGTVVALQFAYGSPNKPMITGLYPSGHSLPAVQEGEMLLQARDGVSQRVDSSGNWTRSTDGNIKDSGKDYALEAFSSKTTLHQEEKNIEGNSAQNINGSWISRVLGAIRIACGGTLYLTCADTMALTSGQDININTARNMDATVQASATLQATNSLHWQAPACYIGNDTDNLFKMVSDLATEVSRLGTAFSTHTHSYAPGTGAAVPTAGASNKTTGTTVSTNSTTIRDKVGAMTGT
jgi:hypothetical protein